MRKAILITLVLAVLALFAVGCQQQPAAGKGIWGDYRAPPKIDYGFNSGLPVDYGAALPADPLPMPGGTIAVGDETVHGVYDEKTGKFTELSTQPAYPDKNHIFIGYSYEPIPKSQEIKWIKITITEADGSTWEADLLI